MYICIRRSIRIIIVSSLNYYHISLIDIDVFNKCQRIQCILVVSCRRQEQDDTRLIQSRRILSQDYPLMYLSLWSILRDDRAMKKNQRKVMDDGWCLMTLVLIASVSIRTLIQSQKRIVDDKQNDINISTVKEEQGRYSIETREYPIDLSEVAR